MHTSQYSVESETQVHNTFKCSTPSHHQWSQFHFIAQSNMKRFDTLKSVFNPNTRCWLMWKSNWAYTKPYAYTPGRLSILHLTTNFMFISLSNIRFTTFQHTISLPIVSYRIVSYRIVSYRIVSYRIVSYRIILSRMKISLHKT